MSEQGRIHSEWKNMLLCSEWKNMPPSSLAHHRDTMVCGETWEGGETWYKEKQPTYLVEAGRVARIRRVVLRNLGHRDYLRGGKCVCAYVCVYVCVCVVE